MTPERPVRPAKPIKSTQNGSKNRHSDAPTRSNHAASGQTERSSRCPLGRGMLTGTIDGSHSLAEGDRRHDHPRFQAGNIEANVAIIQPLKELAAAKRVSVP